MTHRGKNYTKEEDAIIIKCVKQNPENLLEAFDEASKKINRSVEGISSRYYSALKKQQKNKMFTIFSSKAFLHNQKNIARGKNSKQTKKAKKSKSTKSKWMRILAILAE